MIFDRFARAVERGAPELTELLHRTRLFWFPYRAQDVLPKELDHEFVELNRESFHLPFRHIAVEDKASLVFLGDRQERQSGLEGDRDFLEVLPIHAALDNFREGEDLTGGQKRIIQADMKRTWPPGAMIISWGVLKDVVISERTNKFGLNARLDGLAWCTPEGVWDPLDQELRFMEHGDEETLAATIRNIGVAMQEIMFFNQPCRFILECTPDAALKRRQHRSKKVRQRVAREHERPSYTLLKPAEIRKVLHLPDPSAGGPTVRFHERRGFFRTYRHKRFTKMLGKSLWIPATWAGKAEVKIGKKQYKILLGK